MIPKGSNNYSSDISDINLIINNQNANEYLNNYLNSRNYVMDLVTKEAPLEERAVKNGDILPTAEADIRNKDNKNTRKKSKFNGQYEYMKQIYDVMTGKMPSHKTVEVMETPEISKEYGASDLMITIDQKNIRKIAYPTNYLGLKQGHNLGFYALEQLPQQLANPSSDSQI